MHVSMSVLLVLALTCFSVYSDEYCYKDSDCYPLDGNGNWVSDNWLCCNRICVFNPRENLCPCGYGEYECPSGEICSSKWLCEPYTRTEAPTVATTTTRRVLTVFNCESDSDCRENQECYEGIETNGPICVQKSEDLKNTLLHIGLPVGLSLLLLPLFGYCGYKAKTWEERRWLRSYGTGSAHREPARGPQNSRARTTGQPTTSRATELQSVSTASSHNDRTVIDVERAPPSAPQLPLSQTVPADEAMEPRGADQQAGIAVSSSGVVIANSSGSLLPGAPPSYNDIRRLQNREVVEQPPPSYEEAIENYNQDTLISEADPGEGLRGLQPPL